MNKKKKLALRISLFALAALMVLGIAYTSIVMITNSIEENRAEKEQTEQTDEHAGHNHE